MADQALAAARSAWSSNKNMQLQVTREPTSAHSQKSSKNVRLQIIREPTPQKSSLCEDCQEIDLKDAFKPAEYNSGALISGLRQTLSESCPLCRLLTRIRDFNPDLSASQSFCLRLFRRNNSLFIAMLPSLSGSYKLLTDDSRTMRRLLFYGVIISSNFAKTELNKTYIEPKDTCREIVANAINFALVRQWISCCIEPKRRRISFEAFVIDCEANCLVPLTDHMRYLALSYVWGHQYDSSLIDWFEKEIRELPRKLPATIADAITVVRSLNERFLWVDRYCIPKWVDKHVQISNMDLIYMDAVATIVPISRDPSQSSNTGIFGLSCPRKVQPKVYLSDRFLSTNFPHLSYYLSDSKWATRAWTFQEGVLSNVCLFFTEDQVIFASSKEVLYEGLNQTFPSQGHRSEELVYYSNLHSSLRGMNHQFKLSPGNDGLVDYLNDYTSRSLSYESDILKAFQGILRLFRRPSFWGVFGGQSAPEGAVDSWSPVTKDLRSDSATWHERTAQYAFLEGLCWIGCSPFKYTVAGRRRSGFPTWSWTNLRDRIKLIGNTYVFPERPSNTEVSIEHGSRWISISTALRMTSEEDLCYQILTQVLRITGPVTTAYVQFNVDRVWAVFTGESYRCAAYIDSIDSEEFLHKLEQGIRLPVIHILEGRFMAQNMSIWLILDWDGDFARRIGLLCVKHNYREIPSNIQSIVLK